MESKVKEAVQRKMCGYNCAQAVACTYCEQAGLDEETVKNLTQGFAVGMGGSMEATCGAIIGAVNVLGMINKNPQKTMQSARRIISRFKEQNGTVICKELKGIADLFFRFSPDMFRRRGGWRYAVTEVRLQTLFYKMGFIGFFSLLKNVCIRLVTRLLPNGLRSLLYKRLIRG